MSGAASPGLMAAPAPYVEPQEALQRIRAKLIRPLPDDRLLGWLLPLGITILGGLLRFWRITRPGGPTLKTTSITGHGATAVHHSTGIVFDETYYAHDSWSLLHHGVETQGLLTGAACHVANHPCVAFVVHPPLGKWMMAIGEAMFDHGKTEVFNGTIYPSSTLSFRFMGAVLGTLAILMVARVARRMFHSTALGVIAGGLLALDGLEFVQSRTAMLDIYLLFWVLAAFCCLVIDRDDGRRRLANRLQRPLAPQEWGPSLGFRWWRWAAGLCAGAACATKWNGAYYVFGFLILAVVWDFGARRTAGARSGLWWGLLKSLGPAVVAFIVVPIVVYIGSWTGWFMSNQYYAYDHDAYTRAATKWFGLSQTGSWFAHDWAVFHGWWKYQTEIWYYDKTLHASHPYRSVPMGWLLLERPVAYYYETPANKYCGGQACAQEVLGIGNPAIWWACIPAFVAATWMWIIRRDWRAAAVMTTFLFGFVPWVIQELGNVNIPMSQGGPCTGAGDCHRTMFLYYMTPNIPFMVLALTFVIGLAIGHRKQSEVRRILGTSAAALYLAAVVVLFGFFYPVLAGKTITYHQWNERIWFQHSCQSGKWNEYHENAPCWI